MTDSGSGTPLLALLLSALVAGLVGFLVVTLGSPSNPAPPGPRSAQPTATDARLDELAARLVALERRAATPEPADNGRRPVRELDRDAIERIVRDVLAAQGEEATTGESASTNVEAALRELVEVGSQSPRGQELWAKARAEGTIDELVAAFEARARANPNVADAQADLGDAYIQKLLGASDVMSQAGLSMQADRAYDAALEIDDAHWRARFSKAISYTFWPDFMGKKAEAIGHLQLLVRQQELGPPQPGHDQTYLVLGNLYEQQGKTEQAREIWARGFALHPDSAELGAKLSH